MFDRFSENAKRSMSGARNHAVRLGHDFIAPEHLLLGLLDLPECSAVLLLRDGAVDPDELRNALAAQLKPGAAATAGQMPFTHAAKKVLEATLHAALQNGDRHIGTTHVLIGLASEGAPLVTHMLSRLGLDPEALQQRLLQSNAEPDAAGRRLLLISNSTMHGGGYLEHCAAEMRDFLGSKKRVLFVPYALHDHAGYTDKARQAFGKIGHELVSVHEAGNSPVALEHVDAIFIGGGNTFRLLKALYQHSLLQAIQRRVLEGLPYIGSSAGTNVATLSIRTTNDMPIVQPPSFRGLDLVPFQINPHYLDPEPDNRHMGETREERIRQFHEEHETPVLGLREGCMLRIEGKRVELRGTTRARLFRRGAAPEEFTPPCDLSFLLQP